MRIAHYFFRVSEESGGVSRAIYDLLPLLAVAGHEVTLITGSSSQFPEDWNTSGNTVRVVKVPRPSGLFQRLGRPALEGISRILETVDVIHLHGFWRPSNTQVARLARRLGRPYVLTLHGTLDRWSMKRHALRKRIFYHLFERRNLAFAAAVHCTAQAEAEQSRRWIPHDRIVTIPYAVDLTPYGELPTPELFRSRHPQIDDRPSVLFLSRLHPKKGADLLIEAIGLLARRGVDCQLWLAGTGEAAYVRHLKRLAHRWFPETRFLGLVTGAEKLSLYRAADLLALPTHQENFGLVLPESLACGTPVVTTRGTDIWRELEASRGARIVDRSPAAFAEALAELLTDPAKGREMGQAGRRWVFDWLDPDALTRHYERLYRDAVQLTGRDR